MHSLAFRLQLQAAMSAERWSSSLDELHALGNPFLALQGSGPTAQSQQHTRSEEEYEWLYEDPPDEQLPVPDLEPDTEPELEEPGEQPELEEPPGEAYDEEQYHQWSQEDIDKWYNDPMVLSAESTVAKQMQVPWSLRGPRVGPEEGGPSTWRGSKWRPTTKMGEARRSEPQVLEPALLQECRQGEGFAILFVWQGLEQQLIDGSLDPEPQGQRQEQ